jgi:hypothetical protein
VIVFGTAHDRPFPGQLVHGDRRLPHRLHVVDEVAGQRQRVPLDRRDAVRLRERVAGVLLRVGGQHFRLVAVEVSGGEVTAQRGGDGEVADLVACPVPHDPDEAVLRLAVPVVSQHDAHRQLPR